MMKVVRYDNLANMSRRSTLAILSTLLLTLFASCVSNEPTGKPASSLDTLFEAPDFQFTDSTGNPVSRESLQGKVWIVDFIFTRCGGPCPLMTQRMRKLQGLLIEKGYSGADSPIFLVSISVDPEYDTPDVLTEYAALWNADTSNWHFLTGPPESVLLTIREGFKVTASREGSGTDMPNILHSTNFLLVDQNGWIRRIAHLDEQELEPSLVSDAEQLIQAS
jgi:protein SCO1/2